MNEKEIALILQGGKVTPQEAVQMRMQLAGLYSFYSSQLEDILMRKPAIWNELRKAQKSDTATDRVWEATQDGLNETGLAMRLKRIEKMLSSLASIVNMANIDYQHTK